MIAPIHNPRHHSTPTIPRRLLMSLLVLVLLGACSQSDPTPEILAGQRWKMKVHVSADGTTYSYPNSTPCGINFHSTDSCTVIEGLRIDNTLQLDTVHATYTLTYPDLVISGATITRTAQFTDAYTLRYNLTNGDYIMLIPATI